MSKLPVFRKCGDDAAMVFITGDPRNAEPTHVRIVFPGGEVEVTRAKDGADADYWCHIRVVHKSDDEVVVDGEKPAHVTDGRIDIKGKHASESDAGDLNHPELYHLAVRVTRVKE